MKTSDWKRQPNGDFDPDVAVTCGLDPDEHQHLRYGQRLDDGRNWATLTFLSALGECEVEIYTDHLYVRLPDNYNFYSLHGDYSKDPQRFTLSPETMSYTTEYVERFAFNCVYGLVKRKMHRQEKSERVAVKSFLESVQTVGINPEDLTVTVESGWEIDSITVHVEATHKKGGTLTLNDMWVDEKATEVMQFNSPLTIE